MNKPPYIVTNNSISVVWEGKPYTVTNDNPNYHPLRKALLAAKYEDVPNFLDVEKQIENVSVGNIKVENGEVFYRQTKLHGVVVDKLLQFLREGLSDAKPLLRFIEKLMANPSNNSVEQLYTFLSYKTLPITDEGDVIGYKGVREDYYSHTGNPNTVVLQGVVDSSGRILNTIGATIEVARRSVDDNKDRHCSHGLHVGSYDYARDFTNGGHLLMVSFDPSDAVSVPTDCNYQKLRVCKYKVIGEVPVTSKPLQKSCYTVEDDVTPSDVDNSESYDLDCEYEYSDSTVFAIKNYVENREEAPTLKQIQSRLKGIHITCDEIAEICENLGFEIDEDPDAFSQSLVNV